MKHATGSEAARDQRQTRDGWRALVIPAAVAALGVLVFGGLRPLPQAVVLIAAATVLAGIVGMGLTCRKNLRRLAGLGGTLADAVRGVGEAYRLGGDEFCAPAAVRGRDVDALVAGVLAAPAEEGGGFTVAASHGTVLMPEEARTAERSLQIADQRLYASKLQRQRTAAAQQTRDALVQAIQERAPDLGEHGNGVSGLAHAVGSALELPSDDIDVLVRAAELHDVGKVAVPDSILCKPGPLDDVEWGFMRQHTVRRRAHSQRRPRPGAGGPGRALQPRAL